MKHFVIFHKCTYDSVKATQQVIQQVKVFLYNFEHLARMVTQV